MKPRIVLAIDPGASGGFAWSDEAGRVTCDPIPDTEGAIADYISELATLAGGPENVGAVIENVGGFTRAGGPQPGSAMFRFGRSFGFLLGVLAALRIRTELVCPQRWQKHLGIGNASGLKRAEWKRKLKAKAEQLFPSCKVTLATADALLILNWSVSSRGN